MYRLYYFSKRGRAEQIRLLLNELAQSYEDVVVVKGEPFRALQAEGAAKLAFGSVPMLEDGNFRLSQAPAILGYLARAHGLAPQDPRQAALAHSITLGAEDLRIHYFRLFGEGAADKQAKFIAGRWSQRWLPGLSDLLRLNGDNGFFVGESITHADLAVWDALDAIVQWVDGASLDGAERLRKFYGGIQARPRIAEYLASDRRATG